MAVTLTKFADHAMTLEGGDMNAGCNSLKARNVIGLPKRDGARYWGAIVEPGKPGAGAWGLWQEIFPYGK
jgi:hypothetical protein